MFRPHPFSRRSPWLTTVAIAFLFLIPLTAWAEKTDIIVFTNGDRVTGEIVKLEAGLLEYKTDAMGRVNIEWRFIETIITDKQQVIETLDGARLLGKLQKPEDSEDVQLVTATGFVDIDPRQVVTAWPVEATFRDKMDLSVAVGYDYARSTRITNFNAAADFLYQTEERLFSANLRSDITERDDDADKQNRQELRFRMDRNMENRRFRSLLAGYEANDAIGLDRRVYGGGAFGRFLIKSNRTWLKVYGGGQATRERTVGNEEFNSLELLLGGRWRHFQFSSPERRLDTTATIFPSLTESGRWRGDFRTTFKLELVSDLFWTMELYGNYDSDPPDVEAETTDYGVTTGLGWSF